MSLILYNAQTHTQTHVCAPSFCPFLSLSFSRFFSPPYNKFKMLLAFFIFVEFRFVSAGCTIDGVVVAAAVDSFGSCFWLRAYHFYVP